MQAETRTCQNCKQNFTIDPEDFQFYEKIKVPPPTFCPECRMQRRFVARAAMALYWRECALCGNRMLSMYSSDKPYTVYCLSCWNSDKWDATSYGQDYDFSKNFFEQFSRLLKRVPRPSLLVEHGTVENSEYCNQVDHVKNCYLVFNAAYNEQCYYCHSINRSKEAFDSMHLDGCELVYGCFQSQQSYRSSYLINSRNCMDSYFLKDCVNCKDCLGCFGLKDKQYYIFNQPYSKEEYVTELKNMRLDTYEGMSEARKKFDEYISHFPIRSLYQRLTANVSGNYIYESKNCINCFIVNGVERGKYVQFMETPPIKDVMDYTVWGDKAELVYECSGCGFGISNLKFSRVTVQTLNATYADLVTASSNIFASVGLQKKSYCILNKQYSKEEYEKLLPKIIQQMQDMPYVDAKGREYRYGEFWPPFLVDLAYNESIAQEYFPLTKKAANDLGYSWKDAEVRSYAISKKPEDLPSSIDEVNDSILKETIGCMHGGTCEEQCSTAFRIIPQELQFYKRMRLPLPRLCPNCRYYERVRLREQLDLIERKCNCAGISSEDGAYKNTASHFHNEEVCPNKFETSSAEKQIVYCESCYQSEVV